MEKENVIEVKNLIKSYGDVKAVKGISFEVKKGSIFAFLGRNGAGKSTTIDTLCTFLTKDSGNVKIAGYELGKQDDEIRKEIGIVFQDSLLDVLLTVEENLRLRAELYGLKGKELDDAVETAIKNAKVEEFRKRRYGKLSGGQRRRADIARALITNPKILFLDEPTTGLDPETRKEIWKSVKKLQKEKEMTIFLTTHYMEEANSADYVVIIEQGKIVEQGTPSYLKDVYSKNILKIATKEAEEIKKLLEEESIEYKYRDNIFNIIVENTKDSIQILEKAQKHIESFEVIKGTLDDAFIAICGKEISQ